MNTFLKLIVLIAIIVCYYLLLFKMNKDKNQEHNTKTDVKDIVYYALPIIAFTFPTYVLFCWNKIVVLWMILVALLVAYFMIYCTTKGYMTICLVIITIIAIPVFSEYFPITGKQQFEEPLSETSIYEMQINENEDKQFAVQKVIKNNKEYYMFTYLDREQNPVDVKTTAEESDIIIDGSKKDFAKCEVEETLYIYEHTEITDEGENFTFEDEVKYIVYVSEDLYFDTTKK